jgi:hypothetical protein
MMASAGADAAAIHRAAAHHVELTATDVADFKEWSKFLLRGPSVWAKAEHPPLSPAVWSAIWQSVRTDPGESDPMVNFLLLRQDLHPTRFAHYHPKLAPALHRIELARSSPKLIPQAPPTTTGSGGSSSAPTARRTNPTSSPQNLVPSAAPEPSTLLLAAGLTAWAVRAMQRRDRPRDE